MGVQDRPQCFFEIEINREPVGRIMFQLFSDICPKTCKNFLCLCSGTAEGSEDRSVIKSEKTLSFLAKRRTEWEHDGPLEILGWFGGREERKDLWDRRDNIGRRMSGFH